MQSNYNAAGLTAWDQARARLHLSVVPQTTLHSSRHKAPALHFDKLAPSSLQQPSIHVFHRACACSRSRAAVAVPA
jgi:hypothetical protein